MMTSTAILFVWTVVAASGTNISTWRELDWRPLGEFYSAADCERAARELALKAGRFRCVATGKVR